MSAEVAVFNFGCPRSGTTFMARCISALREPFTCKLIEHSDLHPCQSQDGLRELSVALEDRRMVLVRTVRHPMEMADSFVVMRRDGIAQKTGDISDYSDERVVEWIKAESRHAAIQREWFSHRGGADHRWVQVRYESLTTREGREAAAARITDAAGINAVGRELLLEELETFGDPDEVAQIGRLSEGVDRAMSETQRAFFEPRLRAVMEREGYA